MSWGGILGEDKMVEYDNYIILKQVVPKPYKEGFRASGYEIQGELLLPAGIDIVKILTKKLKRKGGKRRKA